MPTVEKAGAPLGAADVIRLQPELNCRENGNGPGNSSYFLRWAAVNHLNSGRKLSGIAERERERAEEKGGRCATVPGHAPVLTCLKGVE